MSMTSYATNFEDVLLLRALAHVEHGVYLDTAAGEPLRGNATQAFYERGWRGINLEPSPTRLRQLRIARPADISLALAAGAAPAQRSWFELAGDTAIAAGGTFDPAVAQQQRAAGREVIQHAVTLTTLDALCAQYLDGPLHFLKLDEAAALDGLDLQRWRPWIIVLRAAGTAPLPALAGARYQLAYADGYNHFYVADEQAALATALALPPHPADHFVLCEDHPYSHPLAGWRQRAERAEAEAAESRTWAQAHVREWRQKFEQVDSAERRASVAEQQASEASERLARMTERAQAAEAQLPGLSARTAHAEGTLNGVYASLSWRLTQPLRDCNLLLSRVRAKARVLPGRVARGVLRRVKGLAGFALRYVNARPRLSFFLRRNISRLPFLVPVMRALKLRLQLSHNNSAASAPVPADLDSLPDTARQVFDDLRRARRQAPHS